ncbi:MucR family transcriptional regulator [Methylobacterium symbioticum]|uniref:Transcriptional regulatory protein ros n=1 Tax=Methylobacterium symbioticum TaxID=2584084 RepID=A0A509ENB7_9HYPH|nr:MucR family transcriptional regulator [Methylobacterium symbioticum]VUD74743.1 Transcriptional regulatory protein ros [Methylobacterium symbioticum]
MSVENGIAPDYVALASEIVSAFVANNSVPVSELAGLIASVHATLSSLDQAAAAPAPLTPAVPIKRSITPDYLVCLEDGKRFKSLKRHLRSRYGLSPEEYRARWNLAPDYPMVAPNYAAARSELARTMGLGQQRRKGRTGTKG